MSATRKQLERTAMKFGVSIPQGITDEELAKLLLQIATGNAPSATPVVVDLGTGKPVEQPVPVSLPPPGVPPPASGILPGEEALPPS